MHLRLAICFCIPLLLGCAGPKSIPSVVSPEAQIEGLPVLSQFVAAINQRNADELDNLIADKFHWRSGDSGGDKQSLITYYMNGSKNDPDSRIKVLSICGAIEEYPLFWVDNGIHRVEPDMAYKVTYQYLHKNLQSVSPTSMTIFIKSGKIAWLVYEQVSP